MFEKEAEEWVENNLHSTEEDYIKAFQDGAEFGYNKGYHDAEEHYMNVIDSQHKLVEESKANEWHYVKDELPELYKDVLVVFSQGDCDVKCLTNHNEWVGRGSWCSLTDVIAWKEIILPKEIKSE